MKKFVKFAVAAAVAGAALQANAWNMAGHMLTGAMVYQELAGANDQQVLRQVVEILREHPDYDTRWAAALARAKSPEEEAQTLLMLAARWPDDARDDDEQHRPTWHYVSFPFGPGPMPVTKYDSSAAPENLVQAFHLASDKVARRFSADPAERAIALCWLLHLGGDAHQPLHAVSMYGQRFPKGDKGGNKQYVRTEFNGQPVNLHSVWDGLVIGSQRFQRVQNEAVRLRNQFPASSFPEAAELNPVAWTRSESFELAKSKAYLGGKLRSVLEEQQQRAPVLPATYLDEAKNLAERRISLAGYRLVGVLNKLLASP